MLYFHAEKWNEISQYFYKTHSTNEGIIGDISDGSIAAALRKEGQFLSVPEHTGLIMCCDGVPVFKLFICTRVSRYVEII